jgi:hypothetical protein
MHEFCRLATLPANVLAAGSAACAPNLAKARAVWKAMRAEKARLLEGEKRAATLTGAIENLRQR